MRLNIKRNEVEYASIFLLTVFSGFLISFHNLSVLFIIASILFAVISFKYFNRVLYLLILYIPFQAALNITPGIDLASGRVLILYLFAVWIIKSLAEKKFIIRFNSQALLILLFLYIACFSILWAWDAERAFRKILVFLSIFPLYFIITSLFPNEGDASTRRLRGFVSETTEGSIVAISPVEPKMQDLHMRFHSPIGTMEPSNLNNHIGKILNALLISGFILSLIGIIQFALQFIIGIDPIINFWSEVIAPIFFGNTFGAEVVSNPSWLVNIGGATILRAISLFPDPHMFSFYLGLLIPIALAIVINKNKNNTNCHSEFISESVNNKGLTAPIFSKLSITETDMVGGCKKKIPELNSGQALKQVQDDKKNKFVFLSNKLFLYLVLFTMLLAELLAFSRGGYLGLIAGIGAVIILSWRYISFNKKIILGLAAGIFVLFVMFSNQSILNRFLSSFNPSEGSNTERMKNWSQGWEVFSDNVLTGVGIGNYSLYLYPAADYRTPIYAHNLYLDIGAEMGIFALIAWLALISITIYQLFKLSRSASDNFTRSISLGLIGSLIWFSVHSFFDTAIYSPTILAVFIIILSLAVMVLGDKNIKNATTRHL